MEPNVDRVALRRYCFLPSPFPTVIVPCRPPPSSFSFFSLCSSLLSHLLVLSLSSHDTMTATTATAAATLFPAVTSLFVLSFSFFFPYVSLFFLLPLCFSLLMFVFCFFFGFVFLF
ncbi:uncharacterized protein DS421_10g301230 [Arachis hypogaea]|nr:uncharacterized protein DS421_10g301230 [Arachis hypogaea]